MTTRFSIVATIMSVLKIILQLMMIIVFVIIVRVFFLQLYFIPSSSMEPTLKSGDFIIVSKMSYGPRILQLQKLYKEGKTEYKRTRGWSHVEKGDVFVFNWPNYPSLSDSNPNFYGDLIVKRCFTVCGDTVVINERMFDNERNEENEENEEMKRIGEEGYEYLEKPLLFPYDNTLNWTIDHYGPLWVPGKGETMKLTTVIRGQHN